VDLDPQPRGSHTSTVASLLFNNQRESSSEMKFGKPKAKKEAPQQNATGPSTRINERDLYQILMRSSGFL
jgi:hypothetical protein